MRTVRNLLVLLALLALLAPASALAASEDVIDDCAQDGVIDGRYSDQELRDAERDLPSDIDEYTDCREAIRSELGSDGGGSGSGGSGSGSGGGAPTDPSLVTEDGAVASAREDIDALRNLTGSGGDGEPSIDVGGRKITPGGSAGGELLGVANTSNDLPGSLLTAIVLLLVTAVTAGVLLLRRRGLSLPSLGNVKRPRFFRR